MAVSSLLLAGLVFIGAELAPAGPETVTLAPDTPTRLGGLEAVCTGVGLDARENPAWSAYPLKVEFAGRGGQYLGDVHVRLSMTSGALASVNCSGPWLLFRLPAGKYRIDADIEGKTVSSAAIVSTSGQSRVILRYPDLGGVAGPAPTLPEPPVPPVSQ